MSKVNFPLFANNNKQNDNQPDYQFSYQDQDNEWHNVAAGWKKRSKNGNVYLSISVSTEELELYRENNEKYKAENAQPAGDGEYDNMSEEDMDELFNFDDEQA